MTDEKRHKRSHRISMSAHKLDCGRSGNFPDGEVGYDSFMRTVHTDDWLTLLACGVLAFIVADESHEAVGNGLATLAVGAR